MSVAHSSFGKLTIGRIAYRWEGVFFFIDNARDYNALAAKGIIRLPITSCITRDHSVAAAFTENGIGQEGGGSSGQSGRSVIYEYYDCLVRIGTSQCDD